MSEKKYTYTEYILDKLIGAHVAIGKIILHNFESEKDKKEITDILLSLLEGWNKLLIKYNSQDMGKEKDG